MKQKTKIFFTITVLLGSVVVLSSCGDGALKRQFTVAGMYSICKPDGYPVVCFADADGKDGGLFCMPLKDVGGKCL